MSNVIDLNSIIIDAKAFLSLVMSIRQLEGNRKPKQPGRIKLLKLMTMIKNRQSHWPSSLLALERL